MNAIHHHRLGKLLLTCLVLIGASGSGRAADVLTLYNQVIKPGCSLNVPVMLNNDESYVGFQFDIHLSNRLAIESSNGNYDITLAGERANGHVLNSYYHSDGNFIRIGVYSINNKKLKGSSGPVVNIRLKATEADTEGESLQESITISNIRFTTPKIKEVKFDDVTATVIEPQQMPLAIKLQKGWNWVSQNTENTQAPSVFLEPLAKNVERLVGATQEIINDEEYGLVGGLTALSPTDGYRLKVTAEQDYASAEGTWCWAEDYPVTLAKGWNWIGYLPFASLPIDMALAGLTPTENDRIVGFDDFADYKDGTWTGTLTELQPGAAYHYQAGSAATFHYPSCYPATAVAPSRALVAEEAMPWPLDAHRHPDNMTIIARLDAGDDYVLGAFCGDECRGIARPVGNMLFLTVHGTVSAKETIRFMACHRESSVLLDIDGQLPFEGQCLGTIGEPLMLHTAGVATAAASSMLHQVDISLQNGRLNLVGNAQRLRLFSPNGVEVLSVSVNANRSISVASLRPSIYTAVITLPDGTAFVKKLCL